MNTDKLLADFLNPQNPSLFAIAQRHGLSIIQLLDWFDSPETQSTLRRLEAAQACRARLAVDVEATVAALASVAHRPLAATASATAFETRRRAASQLLRLAQSPAANPAATRPRAAAPSQHGAAASGPPAQTAAIADPARPAEREQPADHARPVDRAATFVPNAPLNPPAHTPAHVTEAHAVPRSHDRASNPEPDLALEAA